MLVMIHLLLVHNIHKVNVLNLKLDNVIGMDHVTK